MDAGIFVISTIFVCFFVILVIVAWAYYSVKVFTPKRERRQQELRQQQQEKEVAQRAAYEADRKAFWEERSKFVPIKDDIWEILSGNRARGIGGPKDFSDKTVADAKAVLDVLSTTPMTASQICKHGRVAGGEYTVDAAVRYIDQVMRIVRTTDVELIPPSILSNSKQPTMGVVKAFALPADYETAIYPFALESLAVLRRQKAVAATVDGMSGAKFEQYVATLFTRMGYQTEITKHTGDQGIDIIARKDGASLGIQAKRYAGKVGNSAVQEVVGGKAFYKVDKVMVVTNSTFTPSAIALARANDVELWDRDLLKQKAAQYKI